ncbi:MAG: hypothetical protein EPN97_15530 [Alphaproteobacteria bacterium]|nr:MAG: hypothetical protein EPN97_15530 [Alphaproteobacteria bacterium]
MEHNDTGSRVQRHVNVVLAGGRAPDADEIQGQLGMITERSYHVWYCPDTEDAVDFILLKNVDIDIMLLDLTSLNTHYPKRKFLQTKRNVRDIPIIVFTDREDHNLARFVMAEGAAENISQWQIRSDPDRLESVIESCLARDNIFKKEQQKNIADLKAMETKAGPDLENAPYENVNIIKSGFQRNFDETGSTTRWESEGGTF